jgi:hypothetical protein
MYGNHHVRFHFAVFQTQQIQPLLSVVEVVQPQEVEILDIDRADRL